MTPTPTPAPISDMRAFLDMLRKSHLLMGPQIDMLEAIDAELSRRSQAQPVDAERNAHLLAALEAVEGISLFDSYDDARKAIDKLSAVVRTRIIVDSTAPAPQGSPVAVEEQEPDGFDCEYASAARVCGCGFCRALNASESYPERRAHELLRKGLAALVERQQATIAALTPAPVAAERREDWHLDTCGLKYGQAACTCGHSPAPVVAERREYKTGPVEVDESGGIHRPARDLLFAPLSYSPAPQGEKCERLCICADPENCRETIPGRRCKRLEGTGQQPAEAAGEAGELVRDLREARRAILYDTTLNADKIAETIDRAIAALTHSPGPAEARDDTKRLNWIEENWFSIRAGMVEFNFNEMWDQPGESLRAAIDSALSQSRQQGEP